MKHHRVAVLEGELLPREMLLDRSRELMEICAMIERGEIRIASRSAPRSRRKK
jgi:hypothetical protein